MKVFDFMTTRLESVDADATVYDAVEKMVDRRIRSLLVRFPGGDLKDGVITARDIVYRVLAKGKNPSEVKVSEIASRPIACIDKEASLIDAAGLMEENHVARVFVCDGSEIIGVISLMDAMAASLILRARGDHVS
ncbi:MAG: cyclic nucleotide-binding/CBS domain-containing protein [Desulfobacteraceae bacterium]